MFLFRNTHAVNVFEKDLNKKVASSVNHRQASTSKSNYLRIEERKLLLSEESLFYSSNNIFKEDINLVVVMEVFLLLKKLMTTLMK